MPDQYLFFHRQFECFRSLRNHDKNKNVSFPYLSFEGSLVGWEGGDIVYDLWMKQLADAGYAKVFTTYIKWSFEVKE